MVLSCTCKEVVKEEPSVFKVNDANIRQVSIMCYLVCFSVIDA
jgi:hypothetical protein